MKIYYRGLLLIISIFFIIYAFAEEQCCSGTIVYAVHKERSIVSDSKREQGISQMSKARGVYGGGSIIRPKGKKNKAMSSMTKSASLALIHVTITTLVYLFLN